MPSRYGVTLTAASRNKYFEIYMCPGPQLSEIHLFVLNRWGPHCALPPSSGPFFSQSEDQRGFHSLKTHATFNIRYIFSSVLLAAQVPTSIPMEMESLDAPEGNRVTKLTAIGRRSRKRGIPRKRRDRLLTLSLRTTDISVIHMKTRRAERRIFPTST